MSIFFNVSSRMDVHKWIDMDHLDVKVIEILSFDEICFEKFTPCNEHSRNFVGNQSAESKTELPPYFAVLRYYSGVCKTYLELIARIPQ